MHCEKEKLNVLLKTAKGQIDGILKMIEEDRYCIDISNQIQACIAILKKSNYEILKEHLHGCVQNSVGLELDNKLDELTIVLEKLLK